MRREGPEGEPAARAGPVERAQLRHEARLQHVAGVARPGRAGEVAHRAARVEHGAREARAPSSTASRSSMPPTRSISRRTRRSTKRTARVTSALSARTASTPPSRRTTSTRCCSRAQQRRHRVEAGLPDRARAVRDDPERAGARLRRWRPRRWPRRRGRRPRRQATPPTATPAGRRRRASADAAGNRPHHAAGTVPAGLRSEAAAIRRRVHRPGMQRAEAAAARVRVRAGDKEADAAAGTAVMCIARLTCARGMMHPTHGHALQCPRR